MRTWNNDYPMNGLMLYSNGRYVCRIENENAKFNHIIVIADIPNNAIYCDFKNKFSKDETDYLLEIYSRLLAEYEEKLDRASISIWLNKKVEYEKLHFQRSGFYLQCSLCRNWIDMNGLHTIRLELWINKNEVYGSDNWKCSDGQHRYIF